MLSDPNVSDVTLKSLLIAFKRVSFVNVLNYSFPSGNVTPIAKVVYSPNFSMIGVRLCTEASFQFLMLYYTPVILSLKNETFPVFYH